MLVPEELEKAKREANSVEPRYPEDLEYIGAEIKHGRIYRYYKNGDGYWYKSNSTDPNNKY